MSHPAVPVVRYYVHEGYSFPMPVPKAQIARPRTAGPFPYGKPDYENFLASRQIYIRPGKDEVNAQSKALCQALLSSRQQRPVNTLFDDAHFERASQNMQDRSEAKVVQDIGQLIVPSVEALCAFGARNLDIVIESVNESWSGSIPLHVPWPKPDYSVGFRRSAFSPDHRQRLDALVGPTSCASFFVATPDMYFPFLTCEVKGTMASLDVADFQNAHSMTLAVRGVVELFKAVNRAKELHREILAFSVSHNQKNVRIFGYYALIGRHNVSYHRHQIRSFDFRDQGGKERWTAYQFTKNVYEIWMPHHLRRIRSAIQDIPPSLAFTTAGQRETRSRP